MSENDFQTKYGEKYLIILLSFLLLQVAEAPVALGLHDEHVADVASLVVDVVVHALRLSIYDLDLCAITQGNNRAGPQARTRTTAPSFTAR